jgi:acyl carrier protein
VIDNKLHAVVARVLDLQPDQVTDRLSRETEPAWDSFNHLLLVSAVEADFGVVLTVAQIESIRSVGDLAAIVATRGKG